jgi:hypothetical protein
MEGEPDRRPGSPAKRCAVRGGVQVARLPRRMNQPGWLAPAGNRVGVKALGFEFSVLCHLRPVHTGPESRRGEWTCRVAGPVPKTGGREPLRVGTAALLRGRRAAGAAPGLESRGRVTPGGLTPPSSDGHDPAGRRGRSDKAVALGSTPRWPTENVSPLPLAPDRTGTGLLPRTEAGFESPGRHWFDWIPSRIARRWRNWTARSPSKRTIPGSSPGRRTAAR